MDRHLNEVIVIAIGLFAYSPKNHETYLKFNRNLSFSAANRLEIYFVMNETSWLSV